MKLDLGRKLEPVRHTIDGTDIVLIGRRPTYRDRIAEQNARFAAAGEEQRLRLITGWEGIVDGEGKPVEFSEAAFAAAAEQIRGFFDAASMFAWNLFHGAEIDAKNSSAPPASAEAAAGPTTESTDSTRS